MAPDTIKAARQGLREDEELSIAEGKEILGLTTKIALLDKDDHFSTTGSLRGFTPARGFTPSRGFTPTRDPSRG